MSKRTGFEPGTFCWAELATTDATAAKAFYGGLFGWTFEDLSIGDDMVYTAVHVDGDVIAALRQQEGRPPTWMSYIAVEQADASAAKAHELGASIINEPFDVGESGRMAVLADPAGAAFGLWQARQHVGANRVNEPGCLSWNELATPSIRAVQDFYADLFEWTPEPVETPPGTPAIVGVRNRAVGLNANLREARGQPPAWLPYFGVESAVGSAKRVSELGGTVLFGPIDIPVGRMAIATDPQGLIVGLLETQVDGLAA